jgi:hypothetical protein
MKLTWRDGLSTLLFGAIVVVYGFYLAWGSISFIQDSAGKTTLGILDPVGMSGVALVLGIIAAFVGGWIALGAGNAVRYVTGGLGLLSLVLGGLVLFGENLFNNTSVWETVLGAFIASIVLLWGIAIGRHAGMIAHGGETHPRAGMTAA